MKPSLSKAPTYTLLSLTNDSVTTTKQWFIQSTKTPFEL